MAAVARLPAVISSRRPPILPIMLVDSLFLLPYIVTLHALPIIGFELGYRSYRTSFPTYFR